MHTAAQNYTQTHFATNHSLVKKILRHATYAIVPMQTETETERKSTDIEETQAERRAGCHEPCL